MIASSSVDGVIHFWDQATGKERHRLVGHKNAARSLAFSQDGKRLTSFADGMIRRWDRATGRPLRTLGVKEISLGWPNALSPDGATLATVNIADTKIRLWDVEEGVEKRRWEASAQTEAFAFSPDGKMLASGTPWGIIRLWDTTTGRERQPTDVPHGFIKFVRYSPDGSSLVSISSDCRVLWWDLATQKSRRQFTWTGEGRFPMKLSPDGNTLAVMESSASTKPEWEVHLLDVRTGKLLGLQKSLFWSMAFSPDSRLVAFGRKEHRIHVWDVSNRKEIRQINDVPDGGMSLCFSPDSKSLAYGSRGNNPTKLALHLCDVASGKDRTVRILESPYLARLAFSPDGRVLTIIAGNPNTYLVCLWDTVSGKELYRYTGHHEWGGVWSFSPDGKLVAESPPFQRGQITRPLHVWELATGQRIRRFEGHPSFVDSVDFAPDGLSVASGGYDATILLWDITGRCQDGRWHVKPLTPRELEACWMALANEDAAKAYDAVWELAAAPEQAVPFLRKHLSPMPRPDAKAVARWIADLDSSDFAIRQKTNDELSKLGDAIAPALRSALPGKPSLETRRRVQQLLDQSRDWTPERLRVHRAIQALEHISTPSACEVLQTLAEGAPEARRTEEAKTALRRVAR